MSLQPRLAPIVAVSAVVAMGAFALSPSAYAASPARPPLGQLSAVVALSATNVWTFGGTDQPGHSHGTSLIRHWDGSSWSRVKSPNPKGGVVVDLDGASAVSADDIWASGTSVDAAGTVTTLMEHWDGSAWSLVASPNPTGTTAAELQGVSATSGTDAWAAGDYVNSSGAWVPFVEHWNGHAWKLSAISGPSGALQTFLEGVTALSSSDAWVVGQVIDSAGAPVPVAEHWNGHAWKAVSTPTPDGAFASGFSGVAATESSDVWAVGNAVSESGDDTTLVEHWNGRKWRIVASPNAKGSSDDVLAGVSADATDDAWAVGEDTAASGTTVTLIEHWDGTRWTVAKSPNAKSATQSQFVGVSATSTHNAWATGSWYGTAKAHPLDAHWNGKRWQRVR